MGLIATAVERAVAPAGIDLGHGVQMNCDLVLGSGSDTFSAEMTLVLELDDGLPR
jgi:hypothetical protein